MAFTKVVGAGIHTLSNIASHNINSSGIITATKFVGPFEGSIVGTSATFTGNVSIAGTLTYEDVKNVDSVGIITARQGIQIPNDTYKFRSGTSLEMQVWHDGTNSVIKDVRDSGKVRIQADNFDIIDKDASTTVFSAAPGGISSPKLHTFDANINLNDSIIHTGDANTKIRFPSNDTFTVETAGSERLRIDSSGRLLHKHTASRNVGTKTGQLQVINTGNDATISIIQTNNAASAPFLCFGKTRSGDTTGSTIVQNNDSLGQILFAGADGTDVDSIGAWILAQVDGTPGSNDMPGRLIFSTTADGSPTPTERLRIHSNGYMSLGTSSAPTKFGIRGTSGTTDATMQIVGNGVSTLLLGQDSDGGVIRGQGGNSVLKFKTGGDGDSAARLGGTEVFRIRGSNFLIGTTASRAIASTHTSRFQIEGTGTDTSSAHIIFNSNSQTGAFLFLGKSRGTSNASNTLAVNGDQLGTIAFHGADGTDIQSEGAYIRAQVDGTSGSNDMPGRLVFATTADGSSSATERLRIHSDGQIQAGTSGPTYLKYTGSATPHNNNCGTLLGSNNIGLIGQYSSFNQPFDHSTATTSGNWWMLGRSTGTTNEWGLNVRSGGANNNLNVWKIVGDSNGFATYQAFYTYNGQERLRITQDGFVGIGVTNPEVYDSSAKNLVVGSSGQEGITIRSSSPNTGNLVFNDGTNKIAGISFKHDSTASNRYFSFSINNGSSYVEQLRLQDGKLILSNDQNSYITGGSDVFRFTTGGTERVRINGSGNLKLPDSAQLQFGGALSSGDGDLRLYHDGSQSYILNNTSDLRIMSSYIKLRGLNGEDMIVCNQNTSVVLYHNNESRAYTAADGFALSRVNTFPNPNNTGSEITGAMLDIGGNLHLEERYPAGAYSDRQDLVFRFNTGYGQGFTDKFRFTSGGVLTTTGNLGVGVDNPTSKLHTEAAYNQTGATITGGALGYNDVLQCRTSNGHARLTVAGDGTIYGPTSGRKNWFDNGSFDCTYGGRKLNTSMDYGNHHAYGWVTDRFMSRNAVEWSRSTNVPTGKGFSYSTLTNGAGGQMMQAVELPDYGDMGVFEPGSYWCVSIWSTAAMNNSAAAFGRDLGPTGKTNLTLVDNTTNAYASTLETASGTSSGTFTRYYKVFQIPSSIDATAISIYFTWGFQAAGYSTGWQLERVPTGTSKPSPYEHVHPAVTIARCRRYCFRLENTRLMNGYKRNDTEIYWHVNTPVPYPHMPAGSNQNVSPLGAYAISTGILTDFQSQLQNPAITSQSMVIFAYSPSSSSFILRGNTSWSSTHAIAPSWESMEVEFGHGHF